MEEQLYFCRFVWESHKEMRLKETDDGSLYHLRLNNGKVSSGEERQVMGK